MDRWTLLAFALLVWLIMFKLPVYQKAYHDHQAQLDTGAWLLKQCQDPDYAVHLRQDSCDQIIAAFQLPPWRVAVHAGLPPSFTIAWQVWPCLLLLFFLGPSVLLPLYRAHQDRQEERRILRDCSPSLILTSQSLKKSHFA